MRIRRFALAVVFLSVASSCSGGGQDLDDLRKEIRNKDERPAPASVRVRPPPVANPGLRARVGLILATNSRTWAKLVKASTDTGVVVLFVQPGGPADGTDLRRGDVITKVGTEDVANAERAVVALRARPDDRRVLDVVNPEGVHREVAILAKVPGAVNLPQIYGKMIQDAPSDPLPYFLRGQVDDLPHDRKLADATKAVELEPAFAEAVSLRAELKWNRARGTRDAAKVEQLRDQALADWELALDLDPQNTRVLVSRSQALAGIKQARTGLRDAEKARAADHTFPGAHYSIALADALLGRNAQAAEPARRAIDLNPYDVRYYRLLAVIFGRLGRRADAKRTVEAIINLVDDSATKEDLLKVAEGRP